MAPPSKPAHRVLCFQSSSLLETFGGIEYYLDDWLHQFQDLQGRGSAWTVVPLRGKSSPGFAPEYRFSPVPTPAGGLLGKLANRLPVGLFAEGLKAAKAHRPTFLLCGHVALGPLVFLLSRRLKVPFVTMAYGIEAWGNAPPQDEWCLRRADGIFSISHWTKQVLVKRGFAADRISIVQPQLPKAYETLPSPIRPRPEGGPFTLLTVSRLDAREQYKGQDHVIEALHRVRLTEPFLKIRYVIQGDGTDRPRLEALVKEHSLGDIVEFRAPVTDRKAFEHIYREADCFVMPSRFGRWNGRWRGEGFGIVYLEAAAFGLPSIAYGCGGATDIIRDGINGWLVEPDNISELARLISRLAKSRREVFETGVKAHESVMARFTGPVIRGQLAEALGRI